MLFPDLGGSMPIYEYRCKECGFQKEFMQRMSDAPLTDCPKCGKRALTKLVSAAGFQLKGTGWYATDFKNSTSKPAAKPGKTEAKQDKAEAKQDKSEAKPNQSAESSSKESSKSEFACGAGACPACS
jgi:putative FmdB family regulatory protein